MITSCLCADSTKAFSCRTLARRLNAARIAWSVLYFFRSQILASKKVGPQNAHKLHASILKKDEPDLVTWSIYIPKTQGRSVAPPCSVGLSHFILAVHLVVLLRSTASISLHYAPLTSLVAPQAAQRWMAVSKRKPRATELKQITHLLFQQRLRHLI